jgi:Immunity protein family (Imm11)
MAEVNHTYWVLSASGNPNGMLLYSLPAPGPWQGWMSGKIFPTPPAQPLVVKIQPGYEEADPPVFEESPQIMTIEFHEALRAAGVDTLDVYDAEVQSKDGSVRLSGYKAYNIVGLVSAAELSKTEFAPDNPSRQMDASIRSLVVDDSKVRGLLLFRLAESVDTILIHRSVKEALQERRFKGVQFIPPELHIS